MSKMRFGIELLATDRTQNVFRSAIGNAQRAARAIARPITIPIKVAQVGMGFLRDFNLGLRPLIAGIDSLVTRASGLQAVQQSFEALSGRGAERAAGLARWLQEASNGVLRLNEAMAIANRGLAAGLNARQIGSIFDFATKKAVSIGESPAALIENLVEAIATGKTRALDDLGLLREGVEGVAAAFDKVNGSGAFGRLSESAKVAKVAAQVIVEMRQQQAGLNISGNEIVFTWQRIKTSIGDAVDSLMKSIMRSKALKEVLEGTRDTLGRLEAYFDKGGTLKGLLFGEKGGSGLVGVAGAALLDAGKNLGRALAAQLLDAGAALVEGLGRALGGAIDAAEAAAGRIIQEVKKTLGLGGGLTSWFLGQSSKNKFEFLKGIPEMMTHPMAKAIGLKGAEPGSAFNLIVSALRIALRSALPPALMRPQTPGPRAGADGPAGLPAGPLGVAIAGANMAYGAAGFDQMPAQVRAFAAAERIREQADRMRAGIGWGGANAAGAGLGDRLPPGRAAAVAPPEAPPDQADENDPANRFALSARAERGLRVERRQAERDDREAALSGIGIRREAKRSADARIRDLVGQGYEVTSDQRRDIFDDEMSRLGNAQMRDSRERMDAIDARLEQSTQARGRADFKRVFGFEPKRGGGREKEDKATEKTAPTSKLDELIEVMRQVAKALIGNEGEISRAAG